MIKYREITTLYFRDPTLVRINIIKKCYLKQKDYESEGGISSYFALIIRIITETLAEGYVLYKIENEENIVID